MSSLRPRSAHSAEYKLLAQLLKEARLRPRDGKPKLTQEEVAARLGKPKSYPFKVENGERELNIVELYDYCAALEVDFAIFLSDYVRAMVKLRNSSDSPE